MRCRVGSGASGKGGKQTDAFDLDRTFVEAACRRQVCRLKMAIAGRTLTTILCHRTIHVHIFTP